MRLGLIVNPIAGMGGRVGLKGTDNVLEEALKKGAEPIAPTRALEFLNRLKDILLRTQIEIITCPGIMGEREAKEAGFTAQVLPMKLNRETSAEDTKLAVRLLKEANADLIIFVGGDGTARDIFDTQHSSAETLFLGVPSGVKMYSGIFAINPTDAADVVLAFARKETEITEFEIIDSDEIAIRTDSFSVRLHGYMKGPFLPARIQGSKQISPETTDEEENQLAIAKFIIEQRQPKAIWILGPGTTVESVAETLGIRKTVLGIDIYREGRIVHDVDEQRIMKEVNDWKNTWIIVSPIGHQGIIFGRGNQQISPEIIKRVGKEHILVLATRSKIQSIEGRVLRVDTGNSEVDDMLKGYIRVVTDYREWLLMPVK